MDKLKNIIIQNLNHGKILTWNALLAEFSEQDISSEHLDWYEMITQQSYLMKWVNINGLEEIIIHDPHSIEIVTHHQIVYEKVNLTQEDLELSFEIMAYRFQQKWHTHHPFCSFMMPISNLSFRVSMLHPSVSPLKKALVNLRFLTQTPYDLTQFQLSNQQIDILTSIIYQRKNILICGSTGSGKTSFIGSLLNLINPSEHIIVLEDTQELPITSNFWTRMLSDQEAQIDLKTYLTYSLRLSPKRIILGEIRSHEVVPYLLALNTGHNGSLCSVHAQSAPDAIHRLALLFSLYSNLNTLSYDVVLRLIVKSIDVVIFMKDKKIDQMIELKGCENEEAIFCDIL